MGNYLLPMITLLVGLFAGLGLTILFVFLRGKNHISKANKYFEDTKIEAEKHKRDVLMSIKEETFKLKSETDKIIKERKEEISKSEDKLLQREKNLDKREEMLQNRDASLDQKSENLSAMQKQLQTKEVKVEELLKKEMEKLEEISKFSKEKAHDLIMSRVEETMSKEIIDYISEQEAQAKLTAQSKAKQLIVESMQRYSADVASEQTVSTIELPNDEMKGRLIGREGRNIRTIEAVTGVDLIIDDTPEVIVISSFDSLRRQIAKITIETLINDGRIHPTRIEEIYAKVSKDMNDKITEMGNATISELGLSKVDPQLVNLIGKLNFRSSYGQNALQHSKEVANLCGIMASELGENILLAKRAGLLHDIGKAIDFEVEGSHVELGQMVAKKYREDPLIINAIASHHNDVEPTSIISVLVQVADSLSAARPGARNDSLDNYIKRLEQLEEIGSSFEGVEKTYAVQAGRELRVIVKPDEVDDAKIHKVAHDIKEKIESQMQYPGTIKVNVVREVRASEEAK